MKNLEKYKQNIQKDFPYFNISLIRKIGEGDNITAFIVNENYVFRFPKRKEVKRQMIREISVLPIIEPLVNLAIPKFEFIPPEANFVGYKIIHGEPLSPKIFNSLTKKQQKSIQQTLGKFLSQIHKIDLSGLKDCHLKTMNLKEEYSENFKQAQKFIYPNVSRNKRKIITQMFSDYLSNKNYFNYSSALIHNDFSSEHILFDTKNIEINGIIDFGDVAFGDPDYDFMYLLSEFGEEFLKDIFKIYHHKNKKEALKKIHFFSLSNKLQIILGYKNDKSSRGSKNAYEELELWFKKFINKK
ncbi:MAG TPA: phosphotransferase [Hanamia sp.]|nr:phosphotransferase [Hanamia sp.]